MMHRIQELVVKVERLKDLSQQPAGVEWVHQAIHEVAQEVESHDDIAAHYAREIRVELKRLTPCAGQVELISGSKVGEKIVALARYAQLLRQQYLPERRAARSSPVRRPMDRRGSANS